MTDQPASARFQVLLESALQAYEKRAGAMLANSEDPLAARLQTCHSVDEITSLLQSQAQAFDDPRQRDRIFKSIRTTVLTLTPNSSVDYVADDMGLVSQDADGHPHISDHFYRHFSHMGRQYTLRLASYWRYVPLVHM